MMNYSKYLFFIVGIVLSFFVFSSVASAGGSCFATSPTTASFQLTGCPNPGHGALYFVDSPFWWSYTVKSSYAFCNGDGSVSGLVPGTAYNFSGFDSNNLPRGSCSLVTPSLTGTVRVLPNIPSATWTLTGPLTNQSGAGSVNLTNKNTGTYNITFNPVAGYTSTGLNPQSLLLTAGGTITFSRTYTPVPVTAPTLNSPTHTSITTSSAILGANITSNGGAPITARGTCWGLTSTTATTCMAEGGIALGVFSHLRTGLPAGTIIYYRGYATNSAGLTGYSSPVTSFSTLAGATVPTLITLIPASITSSSALLGFSFSNTGGAPITAKGLCWGTTTNPTTNCNDYGPGSGAPGEWGGVITGMPSGTLIYFRAYGTNSAGTGWSAPSMSFTTLGVPVTAPTLISPTHTSITTSSAILGANLTSTGGSPILERGTCWGLTPSTMTNCAPAGGTVLGIYSHLRTLPTGTYVYYRGYATNSAGLTGYSSNNAFYVLWLDLTAGGVVAPATVIAGNPTSFSSTISKNGTTGTVTSFNTLFQFDDADHSTVFASQVAVTPAINAIPLGTAAASASYTFPSAGTWYVRACADNDATFAETIHEWDEWNNCGDPWTQVTVFATTGTLATPNCTISTGLSSCNSMVQWAITNPVLPNSVRQNGVSFSTAVSSPATSRTLSYGSHTFTLYSNSTTVPLVTNTATASCILGTSWNGSMCAVPPVFSCTGVTPSNATIYAGDDVGLSSNTPKTHSVTNTATKCQFSCNTGSSWNGTSCVASSCGDTFCNGTETLLTCPRDCKTKVIQF